MISSEQEGGDLLMYVLDVLRHDEVENLSSIVNMLNDFETIGWRDHWPHDFTKTEVIGALKELLLKKLIRPLSNDDAIQKIVDSDGPVDFEDEDKWWFRLTELGRKALEKWDPPN